MLEISEITQSKFFMGEQGKFTDNKILSEINLNAFDFSARFRNVIRHYSNKVHKLESLRDLININHMVFLDFQNFGHQSLDEAKNIILEYLEAQNYNININANNKEFNNATLTGILSKPTTYFGIEEIEQSKFFVGNHGKLIEDDILSNINLNDIDFPVRFENVINHYSKKICKINDLGELINIDYKILLNFPNCGKQSILDAKKVILDYIDVQYFNIGINAADKEFTKLSLFKNHIEKTPFFVGISGKHIQSEYLENILISNMDFHLRFQQCVNNKGNLRNLNDLLNTDFVDFLFFPNCGNKIIEDARKEIIDFLKAFKFEEQFKEQPQIILIDQLLIDNINKTICKRVDNPQRNIEILLLFLGFEGNEKNTLEEIGHRYKLTRERIRQIVAKTIQLIKKSPKSRLLLLEEMAQYALVFKMEDFINSLVKRGLIERRNTSFLANYIEEILFKPGHLTQDSGFFHISEKHIPDKELALLNIAIKNICQQEDLGLNHIEIDVLCEEINKTTQKLQVNENIVNYLSAKYQDFYVVNNTLYSKMVYHIKYGKHLSQLIFYCLKYLIEPIHFTQLAQFIRENNNNFKNIPDINIHSCLMRFDFCHDVDRGTYALKEANIPRHISAGEAIITLLTERGPLLENDIFKLLRDKYSNWNLKLAIINNVDKLVKIGNNLYDLKGRS